MPSSKAERNKNLISQKEERGTEQILVRPPEVPRHAGFPRGDALCLPSLPANSGPSSGQKAAIDLWFRFLFPSTISLEAVVMSLLYG